MKKALVTMAIFILIAVSAASAHADLDTFLEDLNIQARADRKGFSVRLSSQFGVSLPQVESIMKMVEFPADVFMCLQLGEMTGKQPERVVKTYKSNKRKGWGAIAKELGIKPGSAEFHALKRGDFELIGGGEGTADKGKGKGKGKSKSKGKK